MGVGCGGVKSFRSEGSKQWGDISLSHNCRSNGNAHGRSILGRRFESWSVDAGGGSAAGFEPPTLRSTAACISIRLLLLL